MSIALVAPTPFMDAGVVALSLPPESYVALAADYQSKRDLMMDILARHGFTHFELEMVLFAAALPAASAPEGEWQDPAIARAAVPSVMRRLLDLAAAAP